MYFSGVDANLSQGLVNMRWPLSEYVRLAYAKQIFVPSGLLADTSSWITRCDTFLRGDGNQAQGDALLKEGAGLLTQYTRLTEYEPATDAGPVLAAGGLFALLLWIV